MGKVNNPSHTDRRHPPAEAPVRCQVSLPLAAVLNLRLTQKKLTSLERRGIWPVPREQKHLAT